MVLQLFYRYRLFSFGVAMISMSAFEVLGPIMVGPSSSHTAGALRIALVARSLAPKQLERVEFGSTTPSLIPTLVTALIML